MIIIIIQNNIPNVMVIIIIIIQNNISNALPGVLRKVKIRTTKQ